jgi:hypothetical protein
MPVSEMGYRLLARQIISNEVLAAEDRTVIKEVVYALDLSGDHSLSDVNDKWVYQQRMEANIIYLLSRYEKAVGRAEAELDEAEAVVELDMPKEIPKTAGARKAHIRLDPDVAVHRHRVMLAKELHSDLDRLAKTVFRRDKKLENLNVNYRREQTADENS